MNSNARQDSVRELVRSECLSLFCLQETKLDVITDFDIIQILSLGFDYVYLSPSHTQGGVLVAWKSTVWAVSNPSTRRFSVSIKIRPTSVGGGGVDWWLTSVYGPMNDDDNPTFLDELHELASVRTRPWMINNDFNLIYRAKDKNNTRLN
jgi:exonuclease III